MKKLITLFILLGLIVSLSCSRENPSRCASENLEEGRYRMQYNSISKEYRIEMYLGVPRCGWFEIKRYIDKGVAVNTMNDLAESYEFRKRYRKREKAITKNWRVIE